MDDDLLGIGVMSRRSGLPVSALRYYDGVGVLRPARVDPVTSYRWYTPAQVRTARLIGSLRQAGLPVADLVAVLADPAGADVVLARHRRRLQEDLLAANAHLDAAEAVLREPGRCTVATDDLLAAIAAVRHAVGREDREWPGLAGVLLHLDGSTLRLVTTDRSRLAVATVPAVGVTAASTRAVAPLDLLDRLSSARLPEVGQVVLGESGLELLGLRGASLAAPFPGYERLLPLGTSPGVTVATGELVATAAGADDVVVLRLDRGRVEVHPPSPQDELGFSRTFVLDAVRAARAEHVALALEHGRSALTVSPAGRPRDLGLVMPIRLHPGHAAPAP